MAIPSLRFANFWINRDFFSKTCKQLSVGVLVLIFVLLKINLSMAIFQRLTVQVVEKGSSEKFRYEVALTAYITPSPSCLPLSTSYTSFWRKQIWFFFFYSAPHFSPFLSPPLLLFEWILAGTKGTGGSPPVPFIQADPPTPTIPERRGDQKRGAI